MTEEIKDILGEKPVAYTPNGQPIFPADPEEPEVDESPTVPREPDHFPITNKTNLEMPPDASGTESTEVQHPLPDIPGNPKRSSQTLRMFSDFDLRKAGTEKTVTTGLPVVQPDDGSFPIKKGS